MSASPSTARSRAWANSWRAPLWGPRRRVRRRSLHIRLVYRLPRTEESASKDELLFVLEIQKLPRRLIAQPATLEGEIVLSSWCLVEQLFASSSATVRNVELVQLSP